MQPYGVRAMVWVHTALEAIRNSRGYVQLYGVRAALGATCNRCCDSQSVNQMIFTKQPDAQQKQHWKLRLVKKFVL